MITVTNTNDSGAGSLRQAIADAAVGEEITFSVTGTIALTSGELVISKTIIITGPGSGSLSISSAGDRVFNLTAGLSSISGLTIGNSSSADQGGALHNETTITLSDIIVENATSANGGGVYNLSSINFTNLTIQNCDATAGDGGGLYNAGTMTGTTLNVTGCTSTGNGAGVYQPGGGTMDQTLGSISGNTSTGFGAGIFNAGTYTIEGATISNNVATGNGGGIHNSLGTVTARRCTLSGNDPIGIYSSIATVIVDNSTISTNVATGLYSHISAFTVTHSTITLNVFGYIGEPGTHIDIENTILAGNSNTDVDADTAEITSTGYNAYGTTVNPITAGPGDQFGLTFVTLVLGPLQNNGGPTLTHALLAGSPAIDAGNSTGAPATDQRGAGYPRVIDGTIDIGAFESNIQPTPPAPTPDAVQVLLNESKCYQCFGPISVAQQLELGLLARYLLTLDAMATTDPQSLYDSGKCYGCFGPVSEFDMMKLSLLAKIAVALDAAAATDPQSLLDQSQCFACYAPEGMAGLFELALLDQIASTV